MTRPELTVVALVYIAALVFGMRATGAVLPQAQEVGFGVAAVAAGVTAALLHFRRRRQPAGTATKVIVGAVTAALAVVVGLVCQPLWQPMARPMLALPIAAALALVSPWVIFPLVRAAIEDRAPDGTPATSVGELHVAIAVGAALLVIAAAGFLPVPGRSNVRLVGRHYPSLFIGLPEWKAEQDAATMEFGSIKLRDPRSSADDTGGDRFLALRWMDSDPVQPDEHVTAIAVGGLNVRDRWPAFVSRHEGATFYLESADRLNRAAATIWNCPQDHRVLWIFSYLAGPKSAMLATHEKILKYVRCHTGQQAGAGAGGGVTGAAGAGASGKAGAATQLTRTYPAFVPPTGFVPRASAAGAAGPQGAYESLSGGQEIAFDVAVPGKSDLISQDVAADVVARLLVSADILQSLDRDTPPTRIDVTDLLGHPRRAWSVSGTVGGGDTGAPQREVQMEVMAWYCDVRNLTFIGRYVSPRDHDPQEGVDALLPAVCHVR